MNDNTITKSSSAILGVHIEGDDEIEILKAEADVLDQEVAEQVSDQQGLAEWYVSKMDELKRQRDTIRRQARAMDNALKSRQAALAWRIGPQVEQYVREEIVANGGKRKSVKLLSGNSGFRTSQAKVVLIDEDAFKEWFNTQPDDIRAELQECFDLKFARKTPVLDYFNSTGELPDGFEHHDKTDKFYPSADVPTLPDTD